MRSETWDLLDDALISGRFKSASEAVNCVLVSANDFIEMEDIALMLHAAEKQFQNGSTIKLFKKEETK